MTGGDVGGIFRQRNHNDELAEAIDTIVGHHNGGTSLFDLDTDRRVEVDDHDITAPYVGHLDRLSLGSPKPRHRFIFQSAKQIAFLLGFASERWE